MNAKEPTKSELEILQVLWAFGPSTARFVNDHLNKEKRDLIYMSTLKVMQLMLEKGFWKKMKALRRIFTGRLLRKIKPKAYYWITS